MLKKNQFTKNLEYRFGTNKIQKLEADIEK